MTLYNLHQTQHGYVITKFADHGEIESSYAVSPTACECPAGHRPTCRHRQMLPAMIPIANSHWFYDFDRREIVDISGVAKTTIDRLTAIEPTKVLSPSEIAPSPFDQITGAAAKDITPGAALAPARTTLPSISWRRI